MARPISHCTYRIFAKKYGIDTQGKSFEELAELIYAHETEINDENDIILHKTLYYENDISSDSSLEK